MTAEGSIVTHKGILKNTGREDRKYRQGADHFTSGEDTEKRRSAG